MHSMYHYDHSLGFVDYKYNTYVVEQIQCKQLLL